MVRGDNLICGTTTAGTGTLTLAATPVPPGGVDFDVFCRATGVGFGNSATILVSYTIIEFTDSTFASAKSTEKGIGTLTLGGSSGIANATLARTTIQTTATSLNSQPATQNVPGTAISIGTAANTLVFIGVSAADTIGFHPYFATGLTSMDSLGMPPLFVPGAAAIGGYNTSGVNLGTSFTVYIPIIWVTPMLVKRLSIFIGTAGSGTSNYYGRLYAFGTDGRPSKLLYDFGLFGTANTSFQATGFNSTGAAGNGFFLVPGEYYICVGGSSGVNAAILCVTGGGWPGSLLYSGRAGTRSLAGSYGTLPVSFLQSTDTLTSTPSDPAALTGVAVNGVIVYPVAPLLAAV